MVEDRRIPIPSGLSALLEICQVYRASPEAVAREPFVIYCTCPISPLKYSENSLGKMMLAIEKGLPFVSVPAPMAGGTSPVTLAGTLVTGNAEILGGLVLAPWLAAVLLPALRSAVTDPEQWLRGEEGS